MPDFVSFNEFIDRIDSAKAEYHAPNLQRNMPFAPAAALSMAPVSYDEFEAEFAKMKKFLLSRYEGVQSGHTFLGPGNNFIDCVPFEQQPAVRTSLKAGRKVVDKAPEPSDLAGHRATDPMKRPPVPRPLVPPLRQGLTDIFGNPLACPEGLVPLRRITLSQLARHGKLENFFMKAQDRPFPVPGGKKKRGKSTTTGAKSGAKPRRTAPGAGTGHHWAICQVTDDGPFYGCSHGLNLWDMDPSPGVFNLSQVWLVGHLPGGIQSIESGWQVAPAMWQTSLPVIFVFFNPDNYVKGGRSGYFTNSNHEGFHLVSGSDWILASGLPNTSSPGEANQVGLQMMWELKDDGNWWLFIGQDVDSLEGVGYFPASLYAGGPLTGPADTIQFGGEVAPFDPPRPPGTGPMGSGVAPYDDPADSYGQVAYQHLFYIQTQQGDPLGHPSLESKDTQDGNYYRGSLNPDDEKWRAYFFFGGPGGP